MIQPAKLLRTALVTAVLSTVCVVSASAASVGVGTVNTDALRLRDEASTSATVLGTASKGDTVVVLEDAGNGWYKVDYKSVEGYMSGEYLNVSAKADVTIGYGLVQSQGSPLNVRSGPGTSYGKVTSLNNGAVVVQDFYQLRHRLCQHRLHGHLQGLRRFPRRRRHRCGHRLQQQPGPAGGGLRQAVSRLPLCLRRQRPQQL